MNANPGIYVPIDESADSAAAASIMSAQMSSATESLGIDEENVEAVVGKFSLAWHSLKEVNHGARLYKCSAFSMHPQFVTICGRNLHVHLFNILIFSGIHGHRAEGNLGVLDVVVLPRVVRLLRHWNGLPLLLCQNLGNAVVQ